MIRMDNCKKMPYVFTGNIGSILRDGKNSFIFIVLILAVTAFSQTEKINIAVNDLSAKGIRQSSADIISERLRSELFMTGHFKVMERNEMSNVLKEQGFQKSGACDEATCLVEVGQLLGVQKIIAGSVGKIGSLYTISLRMINVSSGEIVYTVNEDYDGTIEGFIRKTIKIVAGKLALGVRRRTAGKAQLGKKGDIHIISSPTGAEVEIDGVPMTGETPLTIQDISAGKKVITLKRGGYYATRIVNLLPDDLLKISVNLDVGKGAIKVFSNPEAAIVYIDGKKEGVTPCKLNDVATGSHNMTLYKDGFFSKDHKIFIKKDKVGSFTATLKPAAYLTVNANNQAAVILLNGKKVGTGRIKDHTVPLGNNELCIKAPDFDVWKRTINLPQGFHETFNVELKSVFGELKVHTVPDSAKVLLNGQFVGLTPYSWRIQPGKYTLRIEKDTYKEISEDIIIVKNLTMTKIYTLAHTKAYADLEDIKYFKHKKWQWIRRAAFGTGALASLGGALYFNGNVRDGSKVLDELQEDIDNAESEDNAYIRRYDRKKEETDRYVLKRNLSYVASVLFTLGFVVSIPF